MKDNPFQIAEISVSYKPKIKASDRMLISSSSDAEKAFRSVWAFPLELKECFYVLFLNRANKVLGSLLISVGGISGTVVDIRTIFQTALKANSSSILLAHNHPSGNNRASESDIKVTAKAKEAAKLLEMEVLDHLILLPEGYLSFADEGIQ